MLVAAAMIAPLAIFLVVSFFAPVLSLLVLAATDHEVRTAWPGTASALLEWEGNALPADSVVEVFAEELVTSARNGTLMAAANRLNHAMPGARSLVTKTAAAMPLEPGAPALVSLIQIDPRWGDLQTWATLQQASGRVTPFYLLAALDLRQQVDGSVGVNPPEQVVFVEVFVRTFWISVVVAVLCVLLGYPLAYVLAQLPERLAHPLLVLVLLPFWTSVLVRTTAWMVLLQDQGIVNGLLMNLGLISEPLELIYNRTGVYIAMTHVLLPYFVLPLYAVMKRLSPVMMRAALSLGATPMQAFWRVYFMQTLPGTAAGVLMVFILALGYYVTPALVGGPGDQMISYFIAFHTTQSLNWGLAASLSLLLLVTTLILLVISGRVSGRRELAMR